MLQVYYLRTSRQVRLLDIEAKSPLVTHFLETVSGSTTIRAYGWESHFQTELLTRLDYSQKPFYALFTVQQWLSLVLDMTACGVAVLIVAITTSYKSQFSAGSIGVALNLILSFSMQLTHLIKSWTSLETSIGAVARVQGFLEDTPSEERVDCCPVAGEWPKSGSVEFKNVTAGYS